MTLFVYEQLLRDEVVGEHHVKVEEAVAGLGTLGVMVIVRSAVITRFIANHLARPVVPP